MTCSSVLLTCNRSPLPSVAAVIAFHPGLPPRVIVVDGGSTDHTTDVFAGGPGTLGEKPTEDHPEEKRRVLFPRVIKVFSRRHGGRNVRG